NQATSEFEFRRGAVFTQILLADEINRASPKTQSALLEAMEERQVSVDGTTYDLAEPFMVVATANPSRWRAPTACPRRSATASWPRPRWAIPCPAPRRGCSPPRPGPSPRATAT